MRQKILMCAPDFFGVDYVINPWMQGNLGNADLPLATKQWQTLHDALAQHADVALVPPQPKLPDMVFTANAGFVIGNRVVVSRFHAPERQGEEKFFHAWFAANGFDMCDWPQDIPFEGAGDALLDRGADIIWCGYGFRSNATAAGLLEKLYARKTIPLRLIDPRFYHLDTCLCPLAGGYLMYYPPAFDEASQQSIAVHIAPDKRIVVSESDAKLFACNAVDLSGHVFMNGASDELQNRLRQAGFTPVITPLSEYMKAGGAAKCLTLKLQETDA
jgi:N-dimethylarginine dimethylaminohydrolase